MRPSVPGGQQQTPTHCASDDTGKKMMDAMKYKKSTEPRPPATSEMRSRAVWPAFFASLSFAVASAGI